MTGKFFRFKEYISFILDHHLDALVAAVVQKAKAVNLPALKHLSHLSEETLFALSKDGYLFSVFYPILEDKPYEAIISRIAEWKKNTLIIPKDKLEIADVTSVHKLRKEGLIDFLRFYDADAGALIGLFLEIDEFFTACTDIGLKAYEEIHHEELKEKNEIINGVLSNLPLIVCKLDKDGIITQAIGSGLNRLGLKQNQTVGMNLMMHFQPEVQEQIRKATYGKPISFIGRWLHEGRTYYFQNYFFVEQKADKTVIGFSLDITEKVETEQQLNAVKKQEDERRSLSNIFMQIPEIIGLLKGQEGRIDLCNKEFTEVFGEDCIGKTIKQVLPEFESLGYLDFISEVYDSGSSEIIAGFPFKKNQEKKESIFNFILKPYYGFEHQVEGILIYGVDVTQRKLIEHALKRSNKRFQAAVEAMEGILWTNNFRGEMEGEQPGWALLTGQTFDEYQRYGWSTAIHPDDVKPTVHAWNKAVKERIPFVFEHRLRMANKKWGIFSVRAIPVLNNQGEVVEWVGVHTNITEKKKAEQALIESEQRFRGLADQSPIIIFVAEMIGGANKFYFNDLWLEYTGLMKKEAFNDTWESVVHPADLYPVRNTYLNAYMKKESYAINFRLKRKDGEYRWHLFKGNPRYLSNGEFIGFVGIGTDIHDERLLQQQLQANNSQLKRINNDLDSFIYTASHDLKAPISNIEGLLQSIKSQFQLEQLSVSSEMEYMLELIGLSIDRFKATIQDLTEISKVQNFHNDDLQNISFADVLEDVKLSIQDKIIESRPNILINFAQAPAVRFSRKNLNSIVYNLLSNSLKYRNPENELRISMRTFAEKKFTVLEVVDNGLGIKAENINKLFTMFKRFHNHVEGSGIGLYIVKKIIDNSDGKIEVESVEGMGTKFRIYFKNFQD